VLVPPLLAELQGVNLRSVVGAQQTEYVLAMQALETIQGLAIVRFFVSRHEPLPAGMFNVDTSKPLSPENGWLVWAGLFYLASFPAIGTASGLSALVSQLSSTPAQQGSGTVDSVLPLVGALL
jgi:hypothetical protein